MTNVAAPGWQEGADESVNHMREFPDYTFTDVVSPNADTLYSFAWLDLAKEPMVLSVPEMGKRFYMMELMGAWTDVFASPGSRTTGSGKGDFAIVGPGWKGTLPAGIKSLQSPTDVVWLIGRTQTNGKADFAAVHAIQDQYRLVPLSAWGKPSQPPADAPVVAELDVTTPPPAQVARMDAATFFGRLNQLMQDNPPAADDAPALARFAKLGIAPGKPFDAKKLDPAVAAALDAGMQAGRDKLIAEAKAPMGKNVNGWMVLPSTWRTSAPTTRIARSLPWSDWARTCPPMPSIRMPSSTPKASHWTARIGMSSASRKGRCRQSRRSGRSRSTTTSKPSSRTRSIVTPLAIETLSSSIPTGRLRCMCNSNRRARTRNRTGCRPPQARSISSCACIGRSRPSSTAPGRCLRSSGLNSAPRSMSACGRKRTLVHTCPPRDTGYCFRRISRHWVACLTPVQSTHTRFMLMTCTSTSMSTHRQVESR